MNPEAFCYSIFVISTFGILIFSSINCLLNKFIISSGIVYNNYNSMSAKFIRYVSHISVIISKLFLACYICSFFIGITIYLFNHS